jgi:hypothetical protein
MTRATTPSTTTTTTSLSAETSSSSSNTLISPYLSAEFCYFDVRIDDNDNDDNNIGRLVVQLTIPSFLPRHAENFVRLCRGDLVAVDPKATYVGCTFDDTTDYAEYYYTDRTDGGTKVHRPNGRYRWSHVVRGRNRNAIGRATEPIVDAASVRQCTNAVFGGQYYGDVVDVDSNNAIVDEESSSSLSPYINATTVRLGIVLAVSVAGAGYGSSRFALVRVGESPLEWRQRLLLNSGVIGRLVSGHETLHALARRDRRTASSLSPPTIVAAGVLDAK